MSDPSKPICPTCGAPLFARDHGIMTCVSHGALVSHDVLDATFGAGTAEVSRKSASRAAQAPRKCPLDRYATSYLRSASGHLEADGCGRCGSLWIPWTTVDAAFRSVPAPAAGSPAEQRSLMALACARGVLMTPTADPRVRR